MSGQGVHDCHWVYKAFVALKSVRVTVIHSLKVSKTLSFIRSHMVPQFLSNSLISFDLRHLAMESLLALLSDV